MKPPRIVGQVGALPDYGFGFKSLLAWGVLGFMAVEGTAFVMAMASYLYLRGQSALWPPEGQPPSLIWGTAFTIVLLLSEIPNVLIDKAARREDGRLVRILLLTMTAFAVALIVLRFLEFGALSTRWDQNAYASIVWALLILHITHLLTDFGETVGLDVTAFAMPMDGARFSDVSDNAVYWHFVVGSWLPIYALVYWGPRLLGHG